MTLYGWSWLFLFGYVTVMVGFGILGSRRVRNADDFATARGGYGPFLLAVALPQQPRAGPPSWVCLA